MTTTTEPSSQADQSANQLRKNSLGVAAVTFLVVSAAAPLTAVAGGVPLSMLLGNGAGIPLTFLLVTIVLLMFSVGYVAMARHIRNAGAFYAFTAQGLGGLMGALPPFSQSWPIMPCRSACSASSARQRPGFWPASASIFPGGHGPISVLLL
ncbi:hypothetical protein HED55_23345 [Ochrobactrum haematophilum]|uniref:Amino acid permease n=1 Tax=Brucella haematophila TaxID=419474 RepID=A0ABX1DTX7_9HYPH|nr:hypothetical protein [Brucella haematophila]